jgi:hypothetical protein
MLARASGYAFAAAAAASSLQKSLRCICSSGGCSDEKQVTRNRFVSGGQSSDGNPETYRYKAIY